MREKLTRKNMHWQLLIGIMLITLAAPSFSTRVYAESETIRSKHWASDYIVTLEKEGVVTGYEDGTFKANQQVTRAEFAHMAVKLFHYSNCAGQNSQSFSDVAEKTWYSQTLAAASGQGFLEGYEGKAYPNNDVTRQEAAVMVARMLQSESDETVNSYKDSKKISKWAREGVAALTQKGYLQGDPEGVFRPKEGLTRGEAAKLLVAAAGQVYGTAGVYDLKNEAIKGNVTISAPGVILKNGTIEGDLHITEGAAGGEVRLEQVGINGKKIIAEGVSLLE